MFTRDSAVWWFALLTAVVGYLITAAKPPQNWSYLEWLQAASFVLAWLAGYLKASPASLSPDGKAEYKRIAAEKKLLDLNGGQK